MCGLDSVARTGVDVLLSWTFRWHGLFCLEWSSSAPGCQVKLEFCTYIRTSPSTRPCASPARSRREKPRWKTRSPLELLKAETLAWSKYWRAIQIGTDNGGRGPYSRISVFENDYKRSSPEMYVAHPEDCLFVDMGAEHYQDDPGLVQTAVDFKSRVAKICSKEMPF